MDEEKWQPAGMIPGETGSAMLLRIDGRNLDLRDAA